MCRYIKSPIVYYIIKQRSLNNYRHAFTNQVYQEPRCLVLYSADSSDTECFFQVFALYHELFLNCALTSDLGKSFDFQDNQAHVHDSSLFGGFLNRCTISSFIGMDYRYNRSHYFETVSTGINDSCISSRPVQA